MDETTANVNNMHVVTGTSKYPMSQLEPTQYGGMTRTTPSFDFGMPANGGLVAQCPVCKVNHVKYQTDTRLPVTLTDLFCSDKCIEEHKLLPVLMGS